MALLELAAHSLPLPLSFLVREQQGGNGPLLDELRHLPPVMCRAVPVRNRTAPSAPGGTQGAREGASTKEKQRKQWTTLGASAPETPREAAAQPARSVSGSCVPRNGEQHTHGGAGPCRLSHAHASIFAPGEVGAGGARKEAGLAEPDARSGPAHLSP